MEVPKRLLTSGFQLISDYGELADASIIDCANERLSPVGLPFSVVAFWARAIISFCYSWWKSAISASSAKPIYFPMRLSSGCIKAPFKATV
jgi:hypothetical protein